MEPFAFLPAGIGGGLCAFLLFTELKDWPLRFQIYWFLFLSQLVNVTVFFWIPSSISAISGAGTFISWLLFFVYGIFSHIKLPIAFYGWKICLEVYSKYKIYNGDSLLLRWLLFPVCVVAADMITPQLFPWYWGNLAEGSLAFSQAAAFTGIYGTGFFLLFGSAGLALLRDTGEKNAGIVAASVLSFVWILGGYRLLTATEYKIPSSTPNTEDGYLKLSALLVQPNTAPAKREYAENPEYLGQAMSRNLEMALRGSLENLPPPDIIFLPESAVPFHGTDMGEGGAPNESYSSTFHGLTLYITRKTGADLLYNELNQFRDGLKNQVTLLSSETGQITRYDKRRLLAFGEYLPFESSFPFLRSLFSETSRYIPGEKPVPLLGFRSFHRSVRPSPPTPEEIAQIQTPERFRNPTGFPSKEEGVTYQILPLVCYEAMFPSLVQNSLREAKKGVFTLLANPTNDAWFSSKTEAWQHAGTAKFRAIEFGLSLVRPAVSGVSLAVDPYGRNLAIPIESGEIGNRAILLPVTRLSEEGNTFYSRWGNIPFYLYSFLTLLALSFTDFFRKNGQKRTDTGPTRNV
ncbi:apolipoprotein N-acyltransferase [Leptospira fletcheri]|nr:apolipoprotein N-acyltransferase [Leptospira fletcheri]